MSFENRVIAEVKKYECLYNFRALNYKDLNFKDKLWQKVALACGASVEDCKKKWKHLRDCYNRLKRRELKQPPGYSSSRRQSVWRFKSQLDFLSRYPHPKFQVNQEESEESSEPDYFAPLTEVTTKTEEVYAECENVEEMYTEHEKLEVDVSKEFEPDVNNVNNFEECTYKDVLMQEEAIAAPPATKTRASYTKKNDEDSTTLMFRLLDRKIKQAKLTETQISELETSVMLHVYNKLAEYNTPNN